MFKKSVNFLIPYFGKLPNYFPLFLKSCAQNINYNWTLITDDHTLYEYPNNVKVIYTTFENEKKRIQKYFDFTIFLEAPYKFCDFRPTFGIIYEDLIKGFDYWGYCDIDVIYGNLDNFFFKELGQYDKIFDRGHMTLIKNNIKCNRLFMKEVEGELYYQKVLSSRDSFNFDENFLDKLNINTIFNTEGLEVYTNHSFIADVYTKSSNFFLVFDDGIEKKKKVIFVWNNGCLTRYSQNSGEIVKEEYMYMHLQKRKMNLQSAVVNENVYKIIPNSFEKLEVELNEMDRKFRYIKRKHVNLQYFKIRYKNLKTKIRKALAN